MNSQGEITNKENKTPFKENNENKVDYKIVYSEYGFLKILEKDINNKLLSFYNFIQYKNDNISQNFLIGSIYKDNIKDHINIKVKHFSGKRNIVSFDKISINSKLNILIEKLFINDEKNSNDKEYLFYEKKYTKNSQCRLFSCKTGLRELNTGRTIFENNIHDNELLIFFNEIPLSFSSSVRGKSIEISQMNKTAFKRDIDDAQYVAGNNGYTSGRHYFEISLLTEPMIRSIVVGLSIMRDYNLNSIQSFYGYILSDMKKTILNFNDKGEEMNDYGEVCSIKDKIGVLFDCKDDGVYISFYRNKKNLGIAFEKLPNNAVYYPMVELGLCGSKVQINNDVDFPDN